MQSKVLLLTVTLSGLVRSLPVGEHTDHGGAYQVLRILPWSDTELEFMIDLWKKATSYDLNFWKGPSKVGAIVDVMVPPNSQAEIRNLLDANRLQYQVTIQDVERLIVQREKKPQRSSFGAVLRDSVDSGSPYYNFRRYGSYNKMLAYMEAVERAYPHIAKIVELGTTYENRTIKLLKIGYPIDDTSKRAVWIDGGIHAREWAASHTALYFIQQLVSKYETEPSITQYVNKLNIFIAPMLNPDGYEYTRTSVHPKVRLWRKNRSPSTDSNCKGRRETRGCCRGVDLNRNFDFHWGESGSSSEECSQVYHGSRPWSEPESNAVRSFILHSDNRGKVDAFITMHTYSQLWIHPYGHLSNNYPGDVDELLKLGKKAAKALQSVNGKRFVVGSGADTLYPASGGSDDWAKLNANIKYVYLLELRPEERSFGMEFSGFVLEEEELLPCVRETWAGVKVVVDRVINPDGELADVVETPYQFGDGTSHGCYDRYRRCRDWAKRNGGHDLCRTNVAFMSRLCARSCRFCAQWDGFILDESELVPAARETWAGVRVVVDQVLRLNGVTPYRDERRTTTVATTRTTTVNRLPSKAPTSVVQTKASECYDVRYACKKWVTTNSRLCQTVRYFMSQQCAYSCGYC